MTPPDVPGLRVETREIDPVEDLLEYTDAAVPTAWMRRGEGFVGRGAPVLRLERGESGEARHAAAEVWRLVAEQALVDDDVQLPGTGLVAFGAFAFDRRSASSSTLVVPSVVVGRRGQRSWLTRIHLDGESAAEEAFAPTPYGAYWSGTLGPGSLGPDRYQDAVRSALAAIADDEVGKVVLARDLAGTVPAGADLRRLARALSTGYPSTWTYAVDGIVGASPETLVTVSGGTVTARVLAGTAPRGADADGDAVASSALATSAKDLDEHQYAVQSVLSSLRPHTTVLAAADHPMTLKLPNVWHLATDIEGTLGDGASALDLVAALHPTAAVAGTPTEAALSIIRRLEPFDRGRYAGPVGWVDAAGNGEWAIALRCAQFAVVPPGTASESDTIAVVAHAGAGIVAGSDPEAELLETRIKFRPIIEALA